MFGIERAGSARILCPYMLDLAKVQVCQISLQLFERLSHIHTSDVFGAQCIESSPYPVQHLRCGTVAPVQRQLCKNRVFPATLVPEKQRGGSWLELAAR